jgi:hypothetical protein
MLNRCPDSEKEDKYIRVSSLRNRCLISPQLEASLNSTRKTLVSTSTVKRRLLDVGLLDRVPLSSVSVLLPILIFYFYWPVWDMGFSMHPGVTSTVDVETVSSLFPASTLCFWSILCYFNGQNICFLSKTRTFLSDPKLLNGSVHLWHFFMSVRDCGGEIIPGPTSSTASQIVHCIGNRVLFGTQAISSRRDVYTSRIDVSQNPGTVYGFRGESRKSHLSWESRYCCLDVYFELSLTHCYSCT